MNLSEAFLQDQIPVTKRAIVPTTLKLAYDAARLVTKDEPIFNVQSARAQRGRVVQWAVDLAFEKLAQTGQFGDDLRWRDYERPTGKYLEILFSHSALTISQVSNPTKQPRDVGFRQTKRMRSQILMDFMKEDQAELTGRVHILLMHGHGSLNFAHLAIPDPQHSQGFQHKSANLMLMAHAVPQTEAPMENTDIEAVMSLKEEIDKRLRDDRQQ